ncbi:MAG: SCP2 sterol-binding domain-containing protein [Candidatus Lokiarchaeota archaeon]|nr:SCP2 sterol-binding domain-containing protein [Candidatus Lokiarchaeota archaeon]
MKFGTPEWATAYVKAINGNENYRDAAGPSGFPPDGWEGDFLFVVEPSGNLDHEIRMFVGLYHGECTGASILGEGEEKDTEYIFSGKYDAWVQVLKKELDPIRGMLSGKFKLQGDMAKVLKATRAAQELVVSTTMIDTEFY